MYFIQSSSYLQFLVKTSTMTFYDCFMYPVCKWSFYSLVKMRNFVYHILLQDRVNVEKAERLADVLESVLASYEVRKEYLNRPFGCVYCKTNFWNKLVKFRFVTILSWTSSNVFCLSKLVCIGFSSMHSEILVATIVDAFIMQILENTLMLQTFLKSFLCTIFKLQSYICFYERLTPIRNKKYILICCTRSFLFGDLFCCVFHRG